MWLASISRRRPNGRLVYVPDWSASQRRDAERLLRSMVDGVGDATRERLFRMNITLCLHRAVTDAEVAAQPAWFLDARGCGLAGGPVEVLSETVPGALSTKPCAAPHRERFDSSSPHGWIPIGCGLCDSCRARQESAQKWMR